MKAEKPGNLTRANFWLTAIAAALGACGESERERDAPEAALDGSVECGAVDSTFTAIQRSIFEAHGCTAALCHGGVAPKADLALTAEQAYASLVSVPARSPGNAREPLLRVQPGSRAESLLYLKLAARTHDEALPEGAGEPMPAAGLPAVPADKLEALVRWIVAGAPRDGVVKGTEALLGCELPEATPSKAEPLAVPDPAGGFQLRAPGWPLPAGSEDEVCFATRYDLTRSAPPDALMPCPEGRGGPAQQCIAYEEALLLQDGQSHHSNVYAYLGAASAKDPAWGSWSCMGGASSGAACDPERQDVPVGEGGGDCGRDGACASVPRSMPGCVGWGPGDFASKRQLVSGAQGPRADVKLAEGVYGVIPAQGVLVWNSHGFNFTRANTTISLYLNMSYAAPARRQHLNQPIFDDGDLLRVDVRPFERRDICRTLTLPRGARLQYLVGHMHKRGTLFRIWDLPRAACRADDASCVPPEGEPIYRSTRYDDQTILLYDPPRAFDQAEAAQRTLQYCVTYDNGYTTPSSVKRKSTSPPVPGGLAPGGPCKDAELVCLGGDRQGMPCANDHASCGDAGSCDACPLRGGVTTEDEMLLLMGGYHVVQPTGQAE